MKKQVTVHVTTALTLMLEEDDLNEQKIQEMVDSTIANMSYDFSIDTNTSLYDDGIVGSIVETEIVEHEISCVADIEDHEESEGTPFHGNITCTPFGSYRYVGVREGKEFKVLTVFTAPAYEPFKDAVKAMADDYFCFGLTDSDRKNFNALLDDPDKSPRIDIAIHMNLGV